MKQEKTIDKRYRSGGKELRLGLMSAYFPDQAQSDLIFPGPVGNYDDTGYQGMDKTIYQFSQVSSPFVSLQLSTISNVALFQGQSASQPFSFANPIPYDRQFPQLDEAHQCRLTGLSATIELVSGALANVTGNMVLALVPAPTTWGEVTGPIWDTETLALMHGSMTVTAAQLAQQPVNVVWSRIGSLVDTFKSTQPMSLAFDKVRAQRIREAKGFTHNPSRLEDQVGVVGSNFVPTLDCLVPTMIFNFSTDASVRVTVKRYWDLTLMPQDTAVMTSVNKTSKLSEPAAKRVADIMHALPVVPAPTPEKPAASLVEDIAKAVERGGQWIENNKDNIETAAKVFGTTISIGAKLAGALI